MSDEQGVVSLALPVDVWFRRETDEVPIHGNPVVVVGRAGLSPVVWQRRSIVEDADGWCLPGSTRDDVVRTLEEEADTDDERQALGMRRAWWVQSHGEDAGWCHPVVHLPAADRPEDAEAIVTEHRRLAGVVEVEPVPDGRSEEWLAIFRTVLVGLLEQLDDYDQGPGIGVVFDIAVGVTDQLAAG